MYNLNVDLAASAANAVNSLLSESGGNTPRTPEILNSLIAMTSPLDDLQFVNGVAKRAAIATDSAASPASAAAAPAASSCDSNSSSSGCGSAADSPCGSNPPSVQHTCSQLIKAGLKLTIEQKRKLNSRGGSQDEDLLDLDKVSKRIKRDASESEDDRIKLETGLTPEDEERRRRRRERNKIAATKCRLKKRERTANLVHESETLEAQNIDLKQQMQQLQSQKQSLMDILSVHRPLCRHNIGPVTRDHLYRLPPVTSVMESHNYSRPSSVEPPFKSQYGPESFPNCRPSSVDIAFSRTAYGKANNPQPPSIIIEEVSDEYEFTNLDDYGYASPCHNYQSYGGSGMDNGCMA
nr:unnamed protein product [Callosobruchus chinensis]